MLRTRQLFDDQLRQLQQKLLQNGAFVEDMLDRATGALIEHDVELARQVIRDDDAADAMDLEIEQMCMRLLALQQPMSRDLRIIGTAMKVASDVERIGDYSVDIARSAITLAETKYYRPLVDIPQMALMVRNMLRQGLEAFVNRDMDLVAQVVQDDDQVDKTWYRLLGEVQELISQRPELVPEVIPLLLVARYLERVADHTVNIVERVAYIETGQLKDLAASHRTDYVADMPHHEPPSQ